jgi:hypothetical protein
VSDAQLNPLMPCRQKACAPHCLAARVALAGDEHHKVGQIVLSVPQSVVEPGPHAWFASLSVAGGEHVPGGAVVELIGLHPFDEGQLIDDFGQRRQQLAHRRSALAVLLELEGTPQKLLGAAHECQPLIGEQFWRYVLPVQFGEFGFVIEEIELRGAAKHLQIDDVLDALWKVGELRGGRRGWRCTCRRVVCGAKVRCRQVRERGGPKRESSAQKMAA